MRRFSCDPTSLPPNSGDVQVLERWRLTANHLLSRMHNLLQSVCVPGAVEVVSSVLGEKVYCCEGGGGAGESAETEVLTASGQSK